MNCDRCEGLCDLTVLLAILGGVGAFLALLGGC
jgi:hypothetical protein